MHKQSPGTNINCSPICLLPGAPEPTDTSHKETRDSRHETQLTESLGARSDYHPGCQPTETPDVLHATDRRNTPKNRNKHCHEVGRSIGMITPPGPGGYDDVASVVWDATRADGVIVVVFNGDKGTGFSVQAPLLLVNEIPAILRSMADQIERKSQKMDDQSSP